jgi:hypothetical protein
LKIVGLDCTWSKREQSQTKTQLHGVAQSRRRLLRKTTKRRLKLAVFVSVIDLQATINRFVIEHNTKPKPFAWTADPDKKHPRPDAGIKL